MKKQNSIISILPVLFGFFVMGFCDIVGISSDYAREAFGWSPTMAGFVPSMVFVWFLFFSIPVGIKMNAWGRKNTVMLSMAVTLVGMFIPLLKTDWACLESNNAAPFPGIVGSNPTADKLVIYIRII